MTKVNEVIEKTMTTREVAYALGTSVKVIIENARKCSPIEYSIPNNITFLYSPTIYKTIPVITIEMV